MKKTLLTLSLVAVSAVAFGQGKVAFSNNGRPITLGAANKILTADAAFANTAVPDLGGTGSDLPSGKLITVALYAGATSGSETLVTTTPLSSVTSPDDGLFATLSSLTLAGLPSGTAAFFEVFAYDSTLTAAGGIAAMQTLVGSSGKYGGSSGEFTAIPGASPKALDQVAQSSTTWAATPLIVTIQSVPEPADRKSVV